MRNSRSSRVSKAVSSCSRADSLKMSASGAAADVIGQGVEAGCVRSSSVKDSSSEHTAAGAEDGL